MKKIMMLLCVGVLSCGLVACGDEDDSRMAAQSDGDYIDEEASEEYADEEYADEEYTDDGTDAELEAEIEKFDEVYAGEYGPDYQIVLAFDWSEEAQNGLVMIIPNSSNQMDYFNVGEMTGEVGEEQTISGLADYPFSFTVADYEDEGQTLLLKFESVEDDHGTNDGECTVTMQDPSYLREICESMGML